MRAILARIGVSLAILLCAGVCGAIIYGGIWLHKIESFPTPVIPNPKLPAHNAFDDYVAASQYLVDEKNTGDASSHNLGSKYTLAQKKALLSKNAAVYPGLARGLHAPYYNPPIRKFDQLVPYYAGFRGLARVLALQAQIEEAQGHWQNGVWASLDAMRIGEQVPHGGPLIGDLVGIACEMIGRQYLWPAVGHLSAGDTRLVIAKMEALESNEVSLTDVFQQEEWTGQASLLDMARHDKDLSTKTGGRIMARMWLYDYSQYMDKCVTLSRQPYASKLSSPSVPHDPIVSMLVPTYIPCAEKYQANATANDLLLVSLALHAYKLDHGVYPATLGQLAPAYLERIPTDPFGINTPLKYRRAGARYVLYSIGPDEIDDGGQPICTLKASDGTLLKGNVRYRYIGPDSKGDIVAGVNVY